MITAIHKNLHNCLNFTSIPPVWKWKQNVALGGLATPKALDTVGEPETLHQRWENWKADLDVYITASGLTNASQKRAVLLLTWKGTAWNMEKFHWWAKSPCDKQLARDVFQVTIQLFDNTFTLRQNIPNACTKFWQTEPNAGETVNNFITHLKLLVKTCNFAAEANNHVRDKVLLHIKHSELKVRLYCEDNLTLMHLIQVIASYHHKEALILAPPVNTNHISGKMKANSKPKPKEKL